MTREIFQHLIYSERFSRVKNTRYVVGNACIIKLFS